MKEGVWLWSRRSLISVFPGKRGALTAMALLVSLEEFVWFCDWKKKYNSNLQCRRIRRDKHEISCSLKTFTVNLPTKKKRY